MQIRSYHQYIKSCSINWRQPLGKTMYLPAFEAGTEEGDLSEPDFLRGVGLKG